MTDSPPLVSIVIPVYFNEPNLPALFERLQSVTAIASAAFEFVFVDDGSRDESLRLLSEFAGQDPRARVVKLSRNFGSFTAILAGLTYAQGDCCAVISADLQDPPELIPEMIESWKLGHEVVLAVRAGREDRWLDRAFAAVFYWLMRRFALPDMPEGGFDFVLIDRKVVDILVDIREKNTSLMGLILWTGFDRATVTYTRRARDLGTSMWTLRKKLKYFIDSFTAFSYFPIRFMTALGLLGASYAFIHTMVVLLAYLLFSIPVHGWASMMVAILGLGGIQLVMLGVLGEYLWRSLDETRRRPPFIVHRTINFPKPTARSS